MTAPAADGSTQRDTPLARRLQALIRAHGPMRVPHFLTACLWDEQHGYYTTRTPIGAGGDFITAPEISQVFGELLGLWSAVVWQMMGRPAVVTLAEAGPGRGTLMRDALRALARVPDYRTALTVALLESSPTLMAAQRRTLADVRVPLAWMSDLDAAPAPLIVLANEFLDCMPIEQAVKTARGWVPQVVTLGDDGRFALQPAADGQPFLHLAGFQTDAPLGSQFEFAPAPEPLALHAAAARGPLAALYIDYGHTTPTLGATLQAVRGHRYEHIFTSPGEADLSAQVDFSELAAAAERAGLAVDGPITQAEFLGAIGITERAARLIAANPTRANEIETAVARLMAPSGMGTRFKALGIRSPALPRLPGFADQSNIAS